MLVGTDAAFIVNVFGRDRCRSTIFKVKYYIILIISGFEMPRKRQRTSTRGIWSESDLMDAVNLINEGMSKREAARRTGVPERTIRRRLVSQNFTKTGCGPQSYLGTVAERKLVKHVENLQACGFSPTPLTLRTIAFELAKNMGLKQKFNEEKGKAGKAWLASFLERNPTLTVRKAEGVSLARATGMNKPDVNDYFDLLEKTLTENQLIGKPGSIYNMDETGIQLNNEPGKVIAKKGSKDVMNVTSAEKGETITLISCCNAEGNFIPPYCIFKGSNKKKEWEDNLPPGSVIKMSPKSAYVNTEIFRDWLEKHFIPRKASGKVLLLLDGHCSHMNSAITLELAVANDIILLCFPSHTTHYLQPLDRSFFRPLKYFFKDACQSWLIAHQCKDEQGKSRKIGRLQFGELLYKAWTQAATTKNGISGFKATGVVPLDRTVIPEHAFMSLQTENIGIECRQKNISSMTTSGTESNKNGIPPQHYSILDENNMTPITSITDGPVTAIDPNCQPTTSSSNMTEKPTPTKILNKVSPLPKMQITKSKRKQFCKNLTDVGFISEQKLKENKKKKRIPK